MLDVLSAFATKPGWGKTPPWYCNELCGVALTERYYDMDSNEIQEAKSWDVRGQSAPELDNFTCIYVDTDHSYCYEKADAPTPNEPEPEDPSPSPGEPGTKDPSPTPSEPETEPVTIADIGATEIEWEILRRTNKIRLDVGVNPVTTFGLLQKVAGIRTEESVQTGAHARPDGTYFNTILDEHSILYSVAAENLAAGVNSSPDLDRIFNAWMNSSGHYSNLVSSGFTHMGVGKSEAVDSNNQCSCLQLFVGNCRVTEFFVPADMSR